MCHGRKEKVKVIIKGTVETDYSLKPLVTDPKHCKVQVCPHTTIQTEL